MTKETVDGYIKKMSYIYKSVYVELQWWSWKIIFPSDFITVLFCIHTTVGIQKMMKSLNGTGLRTCTLSLWEVWCYTQKRMHMFLNYSGLTYPFLTLRICINNMHSVLIILWSLNFDLSLALWHITALSLGIWQQQQAATLRQSLKHMNKQTIYYSSLHCWAVLFCGPGILAWCLTYDTFSLWWVYWDAISC